MSQAWLMIALLAVLTGCAQDPPKPPILPVRDLRPGINQAFQKHNRQTTESLKALSNAYEAGIEAHRQQHPLIRAKDPRK